jgi:two-component system, OmpR family, alkaline phosphatase synthesis response regulator PhoP
MKSVMGLKILLVDDEPDIVEVIQDRLEAYGLTVVTAGTGLEALKKLSVEKFDGVFLDVKMPEMGGIEALKEIRKRDTKIPVITSRHRPLEKPPLTLLPKVPMNTFLSPLSGKS